MIIPYKLTEMIDNKSMTSFYPKRVMENMSGWFLADAWEVEVLDGRLHTFLFLDGAFYLIFEDRLITPKINSDFSFVVASLDEEKITSEIYMTRKDNKEHELVFNRPVIDIEQNAEDTWPMNSTDFYDCKEERSELL